MFVKCGMDSKIRAQNTQNKWGVREDYYKYLISIITGTIDLRQPAANSMCELHKQCAQTVATGKEKDQIRVVVESVK